VRTGGEGLIRTYGWSTDDPERAAVFAEGDGCGIACEANVLRDRRLCTRWQDESMSRFSVVGGGGGPSCDGRCDGRAVLLAVLRQMIS